MDVGLSLDTCLQDILESSALLWRDDDAGHTYPVCRMEFVPDSMLQMLIEAR